jgi:16S rRNA (guanine527-N7)-methyltransferase
MLLAFYGYSNTKAVSPEGLTKDNVSEDPVIREKEHDMQDIQIAGLSEKQIQIILQHAKSVVEQNKVQNLTRVTDFDKILLLHIEDSLTAREETDVAPQGSILDIGSGAGYPGIPLAVATGRKTVLLESNKRKADFLEKFVSTAHLSSYISVVNLRAEEFATTNKAVFAAVTARAVAQLSIILEYATPLLQSNGMVIAMKANIAEDEIGTGASVAKKLGLELHDIRKFLLSDGLTKRTIVSYIKTGESQITLPRRPGMATKHPLR